MIKKSDLPTTFGEKARQDKAEQEKAALGTLALCLSVFYEVPELDQAGHIKAMGAALKDPATRHEMMDVVYGQLHKTLSLFKSMEDSNQRIRDELTSNPGRDKLAYLRKMQTLDRMEAGDDIKRARVLQAMKPLMDEALGTLGMQDLVKKHTIKTMGRKLTK